MNFDRILVRGAQEHNLKNLDLEIFRGKITVITGVSGSGKSSVAFDTILAESQRRFFYTLSHYSRQFLDIGSRPKVRSVSGLSPAISLAQNETAPSRRATLGSLTDLSELIAVMLARFGDQRCPKHDLPTSAMDKDAIVASIAAAAKGRTICLVVSVAESKKGVFRSQLTSFASKGYQKAWIDGRVKSLEPLPELEREEKHTIKVIIDVLKVKDSGHERLIRSIDAVLELGGGFGEWAICQESGEWKVEDLNVFSIKGGCPVCGHSWPKLDSRYFNPNSLGRCEDCDGYGVPHAQEYTDGADGFDANDTIAEARCGACLGTGVQNDAKSIRIGEFGIHELLSMPLTELFECLQGLLRQKKYKENPAFVRVLEEANQV